MPILRSINCYPITCSDYYPSVTLFLSDLHLGRGGPEESQAAERDVVALLRAYEKRIVEEGGALYLVGDVFDQYMEYKHLVPKGFARLQGVLAEWTDRGIPITYVVGNRDPWHLDYFERELGVRIVHESLDDAAEGLLIHAAHGDGLVPDEWFYNRIRRFLRNRFVARLYRMTLPGDSAFALARWVTWRFSSDGLSNDAAVELLREYAEAALSRPETDLVVLGHCHRAACIPMAGGTYLNPGYWFADRTFGYLDSSGPALFRWSAGRPEPLAASGPANLLALVN